MQEKQVTVVKEFTFDSAHYLPRYRGNCGRLHGHTYRLQVGFAGIPDDETGMVVDFGKIKDTVGKLLHSIDHHNLNELNLLNFPSHMPTAENMVIWFVQHFQDLVNREFDWRAVDIVFVRLWETPTSYAEWRGRETELVNMERSNI